MTDLYLGRVYPASAAPRTAPCAQDAKPAGNGSLTGLQSHTPVPADSLTLLISALQEQTAALNRLASSNESLSQAVSSLIDEMANAEGEDPDAAPRVYMDGSPV